MALTVRKKDESLGKENFETAAPFRSSLRNTTCPITHSANSHRRFPRAELDIFSTAKAVPFENAASVAGL